MEVTIIPQSLTDQAKEIKELLESGRNVSIFSSRNYGKTLLHRLLYETEDIPHEEINLISNGSEIQETL